jgi:hypothetical protein
MEESMLTPEQEKFLEIVEKYESLKKQLKELKPELSRYLTEIGVGTYFQDPSNKVVFKVKKPTGTFVEFPEIGYDRTRKEDEKKGSLSKKEAVEQGFEL